MNFNIIDGNDDLDHNAILEDYQNLDLTVKEIKEKHGIGDRKWRTILKQWGENGITLRSRQNQAKRKQTINFLGAKNYSYDKRINKYKVFKNIRGKQHFFGHFDTEEEAQHRVKYLRMNNWEGLL